MSKIKVMDINLSNKIAAGEVVETLMNVVKELTENSIDAKSKVIKIELLECGTKQIKVIDDGVGMNKEDALNSLKRHATSKIYTDDDLFNINTLGFRGEALPSIASVSKMSIKTSDSKEGTLIEIEGGNITKTEDFSLRKGTIIEVNDLFYNTPARLKYLKNLHTELSNIVSYVNKMALSYPNISFKLLNDNKELFTTDGNNNKLKVINSIYGLEVTKKMIKISSENNDYSIEGYISYPEINRSSRNFITLLVNGRYVKNTNITRTILDSYHTFLPINRYPVVVLDINADPSIVDVNVHPTKMEVKFSKIEQLQELIYKTITNNLHQLVLVPEIKQQQVTKEQTKQNIIPKQNEFIKEKEPVINYEEISFDFNIKEHEETYKEEVKPIKVQGIVHKTYIFGENEDGMYLIDQHAAKERINYEKYLKQLGKETKETVDLLIPIKIEFSNDEYLSLKDKINKLDELNIEYEPFGINTLIIRSHPTWINEKYTKESLRKIIEVIIATKDFSKEKFNEKIAINLSCKMAIKANDYISLEEAQILIEDLLKCDNPYTCPHGRPTIITYSYYELEKLFKRAM